MTRLKSLQQKQKVYCLAPATITRPPTHQPMHMRAHPSTYSGDGVRHHLVVGFRVEVAPGHELGDPSGHRHNRHRLAGVLQREAHRAVAGLSRGVVVWCLVLLVGGVCCCGGVLLFACCCCIVDSRGLLPLFCRGCLCVCVCVCVCVVVVAAGAGAAVVVVAVGGDGLAAATRTPPPRPRPSARARALTESMLPITTNGPSSPIASMTRSVT